MSDVPPGDYPPQPPGGYPPPQQPGGYPPPPQPPGGYPPPPPGGYQPGYQQPYQQQGYGWSQGGGVAGYAGFWARFAAVVLDGLVIGIPTSIVLGVIGLETAMLNLVTFLVGIGYYAMLDGGPKGQTVGRMALSIRVVDATTFQPGIGPGRAAGRQLFKFVSGIVLALGYLWMLWDPNKQTWHDKVVKSVVVKA